MLAGLDQRFGQRTEALMFGDLLTGLLDARRRDHRRDRLAGDFARERPARAVPPGALAGAVAVGLATASVALHQGTRPQVSHVGQLGLQRVAPVAKRAGVDLGGLPLGGDATEVVREPVVECPPRDIQNQAIDSAVNADQSFGGPAAGRGCVPGSHRSGR